LTIGTRRLTVNNRDGGGGRPTTPRRGRIYAFRVFSNPRRGLPATPFTEGGLGGSAACGGGFGKTPGPAGPPSLRKRAGRLRQEQGFRRGGVLPPVASPTPCVGAAMPSAGKKPYRPLGGIPWAGGWGAAEFWGTAGAQCAPLRRLWRSF
jgi:hypothetical protein